MKRGNLQGRAAEQPPRVYRAGDHLALTETRRFSCREHPRFLFTTSRVLVVSDDGRVVVVRPVDEKTGEVADDRADALYSYDRASGDFPIQARWATCYETEPCYSCGGGGRRRRWVPDPLTKPQLEALSKLLEPWCPKDCMSHTSPDRWMSSVTRCVSVPFEVAPDNWQRVDLKHCQVCGRLRRTSASVALRKEYRAPLEAVPAGGAA